jgi:hypothetical protein
MKGILTTKQKQQFHSDFTTVLSIALITNAKGLGTHDLLSIKQCMRKKQVKQALKIVERKYPPHRWKAYVEAQAAPLLKGYMKEMVKI